MNFVNLVPGMIWILCWDEFCVRGEMNLMLCWDELRWKENKRKEKKRKERKRGREQQQTKVTRESHLYRGVTPPVQMWAFVPVEIPNTNIISRLYRLLCTGWIPGTNESYQPVQMPVFPVVNLHMYKRKAPSLTFTCSRFASLRRASVSAQVGHSARSCFWQCRRASLSAMASRTHGTIHGGRPRPCMYRLHYKWLDTNSEASEIESKCNMMSVSNTNVGREKIMKY
jgi:hypothetical protein